MWCDCNYEIAKVTKSVLWRHVAWICLWFPFMHPIHPWIPTISQEESLYTSEIHNVPILIGKLDLDFVFHSLFWIRFLAAEFTASHTRRWEHNITWCTFLFYGRHQSFCFQKALAMICMPIISAPAKEINESLALVINPVNPLKIHDTNLWCSIETNHTHKHESATVNHF